MLFRELTKKMEGKSSKCLGINALKCENPNATSNRELFASERSSSSNWITDLTRVCE